MAGVDETKAALVSIDARTLYFYGSMINQSDCKLSLTRIAPTPSGYLHLGNAASFMLTAGLAKQRQAEILLRIDDLDQDRVRAEYLDDIFDTLRFLGISWDRGPTDPAAFVAGWSQGHRISLYQAALDTLASSGEVFACVCSRSELAEASAGGGYPGTCLSRHIPLDAPGASWRLKTDLDAVVRYRDMLEGEKACPFPSSMKHFLVRRKNGLPSYQLASVVDDIHFGVDFVVRGADLFDSTLAQIYLSQKFPAHPFGETVFFHHPVIMDVSGRKLSKSAGDTSVRYFRMQGEKPGKIFSAIAAAYGIPGAFGRWEELSIQLMKKWRLI